MTSPLNYRDSRFLYCTGGVCDTLNPNGYEKCSLGLGNYKITPDKFEKQNGLNYDRYGKESDNLNAFQ